MKIICAASVLMLAVAVLPGCASVEPAETGSAAAKMQPGDFKVRMNGDVRAYGAISSKPH